MNIQSISIVVPTNGCVNNCKPCVSKMHTNNYNNAFDKSSITKRIKFAANNNVNTCILTGTGEALQNTEFLWNLVEIFRNLNHPFPNVELQTTGVMLKDPNFNNIKLLKELGVNTISLSVFDIFNDDNNIEIAHIHKKLQFELEDMCNFIKEQQFNLRISINMIDLYDDYRAKEILERCKQLGANQITFRKLYHANDNSEQSNWVIENQCSNNTLQRIKNFITGWTKNVNAPNEEYIEGHGKMLYRLPFGAMTYSVMDMSTVIDDNCMSKEENEKLKYVILRENGKLYCQWDDEGSLIF